MSWGLLSYESANLGDEIQSIVAARFLPRVDVLVGRDRLGVDAGNPVCIILNGWFSARPEHWPPHPSIRPLLISMHLDARRARRRFWRRPPAVQFLDPAGRSWLAVHGPVGARDRATCSFLRRRGVPAWYSGCLTLTLPKSTATRDDVVIACDLPEPFLGALRRRTRSPIVSVSHWDQVTRGHAARMEKARALLDLYGHARVVVTSRLHCALPCLALGTPVLFVPVDLDRKRQQPALDLAHSTTPAKFLSGRYMFDVDAPPANPEAWRALADVLAQRCLAFVAANKSGES